MAEWIDLLDPDEAELRKATPPQIHARALEQLLRPARHDDEPRPRLEGHDHYIFGVFLVPVCIREDDRVFYQEVDVVATRERVMTVRKTPDQGHPFDTKPARDSLEAAGESRAGVILYRLVDLIAEDFLDLVDAINEEIDELEDGIDHWRADQVSSRISDLRHDILHIRRTVGPTRDAIRQVVDRRLDVGEGPEVLPRDIEIDFSDAYDKLLRAMDGLDLSRDLLAGARDYHQAKVANDQNEVVKRLTVIASLLLVPTFIVGVYGQNFRHIPELAWGFGYWWSWGWILLTTAAQLLFFRWLGWIGGPPLGRPKLPYFICPNCKERSIDHDRQEGLTRQAVACHRCGFGFLFELIDDYYPAPGTGFVVCDQAGRVLAVGRGVFELTGYNEDDLMGRVAMDSLELNGYEDGKNPAALALEWGVRRLGEKLELRTRAGQRKPVTADFFPAYDDDGGLMIAITPR